jgi:hypothetical protein
MVGLNWNYVLATGDVDQRFGFLIEKDVEIPMDELFDLIEAALEIQEILYTQGTI